MCGPTVIAHGSDDQKERYLARLLRADDVWCQLFSEPASGSDLAALRTTAVRDGDDWVVNGQKVWTTLAHVADYGILLTRTDPDRPKHAGLTMFVVDMHAPGVTVRPLRQMAGGSGFNEVFFDDVRIPDSRAARRARRGLAGRADDADERAGRHRRGRQRPRRLGRGARRARPRPAAGAARRPAGGRPPGGGPGGRRAAGHPVHRLPALHRAQPGRAARPRGRAPASSPAPPPPGSPPTPACGCSATRRSTRRTADGDDTWQRTQATCPGWRSPAAPTRCCATSSASGCWACRRNRAPTRPGRSPGGTR